MVKTMAKFCTECGSEIKDGSQFCTQCGAKAPADQPVTQPMPEEGQKPVDTGETQILTPEETNGGQAAQPQNQAYQPSQTYQPQNQAYQPSQSYQPQGQAYQQTAYQPQTYAQPQQNYNQGGYVGGAPQYNGTQYGGYQQPTQTSGDESDGKVGLGYFVGMQLVYSIPIVRLIVEIVMMCSEKNPTKKNFAKSNFIWLCIGYGILILLSIALASLGLSLASAIGNAFSGGGNYYYW